MLSVSPFIVLFSLILKKRWWAPLIHSQGRTWLQLYCSHVVSVSLTTLQSQFDYRLGFLFSLSRPVADVTGPAQLARREARMNGHM